MSQLSLARAAGVVAALAIVMLILPVQAAPLSPQASAILPAQVAPPAAAQDREAVPGRLVVKFRAGATSQAAGRTMVENQLTPIKDLPGIGAQVVAVGVGRERELAARLAANPLVQYVARDYKVRAAVIPTDPLYAGSQWNLEKIGMPVAWDTTVGTPSVVVAVLDQGISRDHPDLNGQWMYAPGRTPAQHVILQDPGAGCPAATAPEDDGWQSPAFPFTHGTHVSGTIAAEATIAADPAIGIAGTAPGVRILPLKVLDCHGEGFLSDVAAAIEFAANNGARVINMSLSDDGALGGNCAGTAPYLHAAINTANSRNAVVVAAAGNLDPSQPQTLGPHLPAACDSVISVGATTQSDAVASFSTQNATVDISAPGEGIWSTLRMPDSSYSYGSESGTSMAAPHVAGCAALMLSANGALPPATVEQILKDTAVDLGAPGRDDAFGAGRIDCGSAVQEAASRLPSNPTATSTLTRTPTRTSTATPTRTPVTSQCTDRRPRGGLGCAPAAATQTSVPAILPVTDTPVSATNTRTQTPVSATHTPTATPGTGAPAPPGRRPR
jgi:subtilisin family serine protease